MSTKKRTPKASAPLPSADTHRPAGTGSRLGVPKTYKLFIGGAFPRSESGRSYRIDGADGTFAANAARASRKDVRDAVVAARGAFKRWSGATAYNRGQVLYRVAEMLDGRRDQFVAELRTAGLSQAAANADVDAAVDTLVWYAGFADKYAQVMGSANPVAAPFFNFSLPEPTGVVAVIAPQSARLSVLMQVLAPALVSGNTVVLVAPEASPLPAMSFAEVLATSDVPGGTVNILTGQENELAPILASHMDVNAIDLGGVDAARVADLEAVCAENLKRVVRPREWADKPYSTGSIDAIATFVEIKTVWHPIGV